MIDMKNRFIFSAVTAACCSMLFGCGGGASGTSGSSLESDLDTSNLIKGVVVDGYLIGAKVCLDLNANWVCDSGEPSATSSAGGKYTLDISPLKYKDTYDKLVIAEVGPDVKDEATGKTLKEQGQDGYVLASWGGPKPILTPINTLIAASYFKNGLKDMNNRFEAARLLENSGLSSTNEDYFDTAAKMTSDERALAKRTGRVLAAALAHSQNQLKSKVPTVYGSSAIGLGERAADLLTQAVRATRASSSSESEGDQLTRIKAQTASIELTAENEKLLKKEVSILSPSDALLVLSSGLYDATLLASTPRNVHVFTAQGDGGSLTFKSLQYRTNAWTQDATYQSQGGAGYRVLYRDYSKIVGSQVASSKVSIAAPILAKDGESVLKEIFTSDTKAPSRHVQLLVRGAQDLSYSSVPALSGFGGSFSAVHKLYQVRRTTISEEYVFDEVASFFTSLAAFKASPRTCYGGVCWSITKQAMGNFPEVSGTMKFTTTSSAGSLDLGEGKFIEDEIAGVFFLRMINIPIAVQNRSSFWSAKDGRYPLFGDLDNKLWTGRYSPAGTSWISDWLLPRDALNAALALAPLNPVTP
jgi:hypothetical protein